MKCVNHLSTEAVVMKKGTSLCAKCAYNPGYYALLMPGEH